MNVCVHWHSPVLHKQQSGYTTSVQISGGAFLIPTFRIHNSTMDTMK